jgi:hypothetical protein
MIGQPSFHSGRDSERFVYSAIPIRIDKLLRSANDVLT